MANLQKGSDCVRAHRYSRNFSHNHPRNVNAEYEHTESTITSNSNNSEGYFIMDIIVNQPAVCPLLADGSFQHCLMLNGKIKGLPVSSPTIHSAFTAVKKSAPVILVYYENR